MLLLMLVFCLGCDAPWREFHSTEGRFAVLAPSTPQEEVGAGPTQLCAAAEREWLFVDAPHLPITRWALAIPSGYLVGFCTLTRRGEVRRSLDDELQYERDALIKGAKLDLVTSQRIERAGVPIIEYMTRSGDGIVSRTRLLIAAGMRYRLTVVGEAGREVGSARADRFLDSFRFLGTSAK
jgi:hypothetical protein